VTESPLAAMIIHDLAGYLTSVHGFLEIVQARPDHPARDDLFSSAVSESGIALQALKDLQFVRSVDAGDLLEQVTDVPLQEVLDPVRERLSEEHGATLAPAAPGLVSVNADRDLFADVLGRCIAAALATNAEAAHDVMTTVASDTVRIDIDFGPSTDLNDVEEGARTGRKVMRPLALAQLLLTRWGGYLQTEVSERSRISLFLRRV